MLKIKKNLLEFKDDVYTKVNEKFLNTFGIVLQALMFIAIGIIIITMYEALGTIAIYTISAILIVSSLINTIQMTLNKKVDFKFIKLLKNLIAIIVSIYFINNPSMFIEIFPLLFTAYVAIDSVIKTVTLIISYENKLEGRFKLTVRTIITYLFLIILLMYPMFRFSITIILGGVYFIVLGIVYLIDAIELSVSKKNKNKVKSKIKIVLPVFISAFIPFRIINEINRLFYINEAKKVVIKKEDEMTQIQILVHMKDLSYDKFGHVDIAIDGAVYSYGSYDENNIKFNTAIGHGVLFEVNKEKYIDFCTNKEHKNIIEFGLSLKKEDKLKIIDKLNDIKTNSYKWNCLNEENKTDTYKDYASRLYLNTKAKFNKFKKGNFKTYFTLSTNCVKLVDTLLSSIDSDIISINGVITPGTYYDYLNRQFRRKNTIVTTKEIYLNSTES